MKEHWKPDEIWRYSKYVMLALVVVAYCKDVTCSIFKFKATFLSQMSGVKLLLQLHVT